jgi:DNA-directed RNA polymerase subunit K/omega
VSAPASVARPSADDGFRVYTEGDRFLLSAIAFLRSRQLKAGAAARIESQGHKSTYVAVHEVLANTISWSRV